MERLTIKEFICKMTKFRIIECKDETNGTYYVIEHNLANEAEYSRDDTIFKSFEAAKACIEYICNGFNEAYK